MADDIETVKALLLKPEIMQYFTQHMKELPQQLQTAFSTIVSGGQKATETVKNVATAAQAMTKDISQSNPIVKDLISGFQSLNGVSLDDVGLGIFHTNKGLSEGAIKAAEFIGAFSGKLPIADALNAAGDQAKIATASLVENADAFNKNVLSKFGKGGEEVGELIRNLYAVAEPAKKFEESMTAMQISSGNLNGFLSEVGKKFETLPNYAQKFSDVTVQVGNATGTSSVEVAKYAMKLGQIPGAMEQTIRSFESGTANITLLQGAMTIATATGQSFDQVFDRMNERYRTFNTSGEDVLKQFSRMAQVSRDLQMPMDIVKNALSKNSEEFKYLGDNTLSSIGLLERFGTALAGKMGTGAIADLTSSMISNMNRLDTAQNAFLSKSSGGPGGLRGAAQIQQLKEEGKTEEIFDMFKQSLNKQFGGKIVTRDEAAQDERAAGQYYKQVQLLTTGPTKLAGSEAEANRLLQMMKEDKGYDKSKTPEKALHDTMQVGHDIQKRHLDELLLIRNSVAGIANNMSIRQYTNVRELLGSEGTNKSSFVETMMRDQGIKAGDAAKSRGRHPDQIISDFVEDPAKILHGNLAAGLKATFEDGKEQFGGILDRIGLTKFIPKQLLSSESDSTPKREMPQAKQQVVQAMSRAEDKEGRTTAHAHSPVEVRQQKNNNGRIDVVSHHICSACKKTIDSQLVASVVEGVVKSNNASAITNSIGVPIANTPSSYQ